MKETNNKALEHDKKNLVTLYSEICKSYHIIDDFRMKLLSLLPLFSIVGVLFLDNNTNNGEEMISFISIFAALFTVSLFIYEIRGIKRSDNLIKKGREIEKDLGFENQGQFFICEIEQENNKLFAFNATFAACLVYSLVFAAWLYIFLEHGTKYETPICVLWAAASGIIVAIVSNIYLNKHYTAA